jgi:transposase
MPAGVRIWIASGYTDMRRGMRGLALQVQEGLGRDPFAGDIYIFRGRSGSLIKALWHDGLGLSLYANVWIGVVLFGRKPSMARCL